MGVAVTIADFVFFRKSRGRKKTKENLSVPTVDMGNITCVAPMCLVIADL